MLGALAAAAGIAALPVHADQQPAPAAAAAPATTSAKSAAPIADDDLELLEFLGSIDAESADNDWLEFLRSTDIGKVAKATAPANRGAGKGK